MTQVEKIQFLLSGPGLIGHQHAKQIQARQDCNLAAIVAPDTDENRALAASFSTKLFSDLNEAIASVKIDAAIISSPNEFHYEQARICNLKNIPSLVEKPITSNIIDAKKLVDLVEETHVPILVGHHRTYSPLITAAQKFLQSDQFGKLVALQGSALFFKPDHYFDDGPWRKFKGGGPILINLIHEIGLMRIFGGEISSVQAISANNIRNFEVEDTVAISLRFASGALGTFILSDTAASSKSWEMTSGENPSYPFFPKETCYHFAGTKGSLDFPNMMVKSYPNQADRSWWKPFEEKRLQFERKDPLIGQLQHFIDVLRDNAKPMVTAYDGYRNMAVLDAIQKSIQNGCSVTVSV